MEPRVKKKPSKAEEVLQEKLRLLDMTRGVVEMGGDVFKWRPILPTPTLQAVWMDPDYPGEGDKWESKDDMMLVSERRRLHAELKPVLDKAVDFARQRPERSIRRRNQKLVGLSEEDADIIAIYGSYLRYCTEESSGIAIAAAILFGAALQREGSRRVDEVLQTGFGVTEAGRVRIVEDDKRALIWEAVQALKKSDPSISSTKAQTDVGKQFDRSRSLVRRICIEFEGKPPK